MGWNSIRAYSKVTLDFRRVLKYVSSVLTTKYYLPQTSAFKMKFYNFIKILYEKESITPQELLGLLIKNPGLLDLIYKCKFKELKAKMRLLLDKPTYRDLTFVSLFYDEYFITQNFYRAVRAVTRYPFDVFDIAFLSAIFTKYPFLRDKKHLDHVVDKLKEKRYAYYLIESGIQEVYQ